MKVLLVLSAICIAGALGSKFRHLAEDDDWEDMMMSDAGTSTGILLNWDDKCNELVNELIKMKMESTFQAIAIAVFFRRHDADIIGMSLMYNAWARIKINSAKDLMMYLVKRGASVQFPDVAAPAQTQWADLSDALKLSLANERQIAEQINELAKHATKHNDAHLLAYIQENLVNQQADNMFEVSALINKLARGGNKFGLMAVNQQAVKKYRDFVDCKSDTEKYKWNY